MSAKHGGGLPHVLYGHRCRPRDIEVSCPRCGHLARARKKSEENERHFHLVGDLSPNWFLNDWTIRCTDCVYRAEDVAYDDLPARYWTFDVGDLVVWAWNRDHLVFLSKYLNGEDTTRDPYGWLGAYVHGAWKQDGARIATAIAARLEKASVHG